MEEKRFARVRRATLVVVLMMCVSFIGCVPNFRQYRVDGQRAFLDGRFAAARGDYRQALRLRPEDADNLFDLGSVCMVFARRALAEHQRPAATRELDRAIEYFSRSIEAHPGSQASLIAKNDALELRGKFDEALRDAEWAMTFVGPSARAHLFMADELEERGDFDGAMLRFRQAVAIEPDNPKAHASFGRFLLRLGDRKAAVDHLNRAYELNPLESGVAESLTDLGQPLPRTTAPLEP